MSNLWVYLPYLGAVVWSLVSLACIWFTMCTQRAYWQRRFILQKLMNSNNYEHWRARLNELERVGLRTHTWAFFLFKDPKQLYSAQMRDIWDDN